MVGETGAKTRNYKKSTRTAKNGKYDHIYIFFRIFHDGFMGEKKLNDRPFYVSIESVVLLNEDLSSTDKIVYGIISVFSMNQDGYCYLRYKQIAKYAHIKKRNLYNCIKKLISKQYITKIVKNDRVYLMPTTNAFIQMRETKKFDKDQFYYDWLDEEE